MQSSEEGELVDGLPGLVLAQLDQSSQCLAVSCRMRLQQTLHSPQAKLRDLRAEGEKKRTSTCQGNVLT